MSREKTMVILMNVREVMAAIGISRVHIWRRVKEGRFPAPVRISGDKKHRYFRQEEITAWAVEYAAWKRGTAKRSRKVAL